MTTGYIFQLVVHYHSGSSFTQFLNNHSTALNRVQKNVADALQNTVGNYLNQIAYL